MPISLRLSPEVEAQIAGYGARAGLSKSAVIVRSIQEFLQRHAQPSSQQIYEAAMQAAQSSPDCPGVDAQREALELRAHKLQVRQALRTKHAQRSKPPSRKAP